MSNIPDEMRRGYVVGIRTREIVLYRNGSAVESINIKKGFDVDKVREVIDDWIDYSWTLDGTFRTSTTTYHSIGPE